jgi:2-polyprenyl-3-methyl-5-hydroxy-6-metoxy-1,4-benzoquinol methylase
MQKNTPELWDALWTDTIKEQDLFNLKKEENSIRWQRIEKIILKEFKEFRGLNVIEVGAGSGTNALLFAKRGAKVTILDYSKNAIKRSKEFFDRHNCEADYLFADALNLPKNLERKYDIAISFGLAEHFIGEKRKRIIKSHFNLIKKNGLVLISVPNKYNFPYRMNKFISELIGTWKFGEEYPFSRKEFLIVAKELEINPLCFLGDSFGNSLKFINPFLILKKLFKIQSKIKKEKGSRLDEYLGYSLIFIGKPNKPTTIN